MSRKPKNKSWVRQSVRHDYLTPPDFIEILLGFLKRDKFDLDVCCSIGNIPATERFYCGAYHPGAKRTNGLSSRWERGGVNWMNPPCGTELQKFCHKMLHEVKKGARVWALLPMRFPDYYVTQFKDGTPGVLRQASLIYIIPEWTFEFGLPEGKSAGKAKSSWWLCYFGADGPAVEYAFRAIDPFKGTTYEGVLLCPAR
jgi:hypothetical protein